MAADILPVLISLSNCLTSSFTLGFFCFGCLIWRAFASVIMKRLSVLEFDPFVSDFVFGSSRCGRTLAAFLAKLEFGVFPTNDNNWWFSSSTNWKPGLFLLRIMTPGFQLKELLYRSFFVISNSWSISFQGSKGL